MARPNRPPCVLLVEDETEILEVVEEYLVASGYEVISAGSGREALDRVRALDTGPEIALVDWNLPGIAGRDVIADLAEMCPGTRILVLTGEPRHNLANRPGPHPWCGVISKPFSLSALARRVAEEVDIHRARSCG